MMIYHHHLSGREGDRGSPFFMCVVGGRGHSRVSPFVCDIIISMGGGANGGEGWKAW